MAAHPAKVSRFFTSHRLLGSDPKGWVLFGSGKSLESGQGTQRKKRTFMRPDALHSRLINVKAQKKSSFRGHEMLQLGKG